jgi:polysaccharide export outer membrane protein
LILKLIRTFAPVTLLLVGACAPDLSTLPMSSGAGSSAVLEYLVGPGDQLNVFVWRNPELTVTLPVRPDGKISMPLVEDVVAVGTTPTALARTIETRLKPFVVDPHVTVIVQGFVGAQQVRVIGEAAQPRAIPYRVDMTVLDVMIIAGGLTKFAAGNRAVIVRIVDDKPQSFPVRLDSLIKDGEVKYNVPMQPGDILIIPQTYF